ncbi:unnamed protein product [Miscanthus lutarioriparius]|uniref:Uncharacterized protein n=1 Tax=Miscanthus lutarioriparius TaxID=422564 RepID=A0A811QR22_9POAL|nr:unnamed protein product [Miscanthus lutarioriparius]
MKRKARQCRAPDRGGLVASGMARPRRGSASAARHSVGVEQAVSTLDVGDGQSEFRVARLRGRVRAARETGSARSPTRRDSAASVVLIRWGLDIEGWKSNGLRGPALECRGSCHVQCGGARANYALAMEIAPEAGGGGRRDGSGAPSPLPSRHLLSPLLAVAKARTVEDCQALAPWPPDAWHLTTHPPIAGRPPPQLASPSISQLRTAAPRRSSLSSSPIVTKQRRATAGPISLGGARARQALRVRAGALGCTGKGLW